MKRLTIATVLASSLVIIALPTFSQNQHHAKKGGQEMQKKSGMDMDQMMKGMGGMMHGGMMSDPVMKVLHNFGKPGFYEKHAEELALTDGQVKKLESIWFNHKKEAIRKKADMEIAQLELKKILSDAHSDFKKAEAKIAKIGSLEGALRLDYLQSIENVRTVLTAEQLEKFSELKEGGMMMKGMEHGQMMQGKMRVMMEGMGKGKIGEIVK